MNKKALLVGCDYEGTGSELKGCSKDVLDMRELLKKHDFVTNVLCDDTERYISDVTGKPTHFNLTVNFNTFTIDNGPKAFFHYSGHGSYTWDRTGDEKDRKDELIVTTDMKGITDDVLNKQVLSKFTKGTRVFILADCCNSGSIMDLKYRTNHSEYLHDDTVENPNDSTVADIVCISGCLDRQTSADAYLSGSYRGAMTTAFIYAHDKTNGGQVSLQEYVKIMRKWLKDHRFRQIPQLTYNNPKAVDRLMADYL